MAFKSRYGFKYKIPASAVSYECAFYKQLFLIGTAGPEELAGPFATLHDEEG